MNVLKMERRLVEQPSHETAIDGYFIGCESSENDLAGKGYKFRIHREEQVILLMVYDVNTGVPLVSWIYEGASNDKVSVKDFVDQVEMKDMLFIVNRGFFSNDNIKQRKRIYYSNGQEPARLQKVVHSLEMHDRFLYQKGEKAAIVEYMDEIINGYRVLTFRDLNEVATEQQNHLRHMALGHIVYTQEGAEKQKYFVGVTVLQTSLEEKHQKKSTSSTKSAGNWMPSTTSSRTRTIMHHSTRKITTRRKDWHTSCWMLH